MFPIIRIAVEVLTAIVDIVSLSYALHHLAEANPVKALAAIGIGLVCVISLASGVILCEVAKWYVAQYLRNLELEQQKLGQSGLEGSGVTSDN